MEAQEGYREFSRQEHRRLARYFADWAWVRDLDGIVFDDNLIRRYLNLERIKKIRADWISEDIRPWFPYNMKFYYFQGNQKSLASMYVSRAPIDGKLPGGMMSDAERVSGAQHSGLRIREFKYLRLKFEKAFDRQTVIEYLHEVSDGYQMPGRSNAERVAGVLLRRHLSRFGEKTGLTIHRGKLIAQFLEKIDFDDEDDAVSYLKDMRDELKGD